MLLCSYDGSFSISIDPYEQAVRISSAAVPSILVSKHESGPENRSRDIPVYEPVAGEEDMKPQKGSFDLKSVPNRVRIGVPSALRASCEIATGDASPRTYRQTGRRARWAL